MNLQSQKIDLAQRILSSNNKTLIHQLHEWVSHVEEVDLWDELSDEQKSMVKKAQQQAAKGEVIAHEMVMKKYKKWLTK
ncbi:MAG: hypothetical protein RIQ33_2257 [Bacteroidota bacterium]|jgi:adenylate kinase family enzyme